MKSERNKAMAERIESSAVSYPFRFLIAGDSGAWADPTSDGIFSQLVNQMEKLDPPPLFFVNLGDFAGPGTIDRHMHYLELVESLSIANFCVVGNHDLDDENGPDAFARVHGPMNVDFSYGHTRFVVMHATPGVPGEIMDRFAETFEGTQGPREEDLVFLANALRSATERHRVVLMHMPSLYGRPLCSTCRLGVQTSGARVLRPPTRARCEARVLRPRPCIRHTCT